MSIVQDRPLVNMLAWIALGINGLLLIAVALELRFHYWTLNLSFPPTLIFLSICLCLLSFPIFSIREVFTLTKEYFPDKEINAHKKRTIMLLLILQACSVLFEGFVGVVMLSNFQQFIIQYRPNLELLNFSMAFLMIVSGIVNLIMLFLLGGLRKAIIKNCRAIMLNSFASGPFAEI
jgi:hypothetical protein